MKLPPSMMMTPKLLYDEIRKRWVLATPEEIVRQSLVKKMTCELGYPKELLVIEKELKELSYLHSSSERRADLICFAKEIHPEHSLYPLLLVECKERGFFQSAKEQVIGYNHLVKAPFVAIASPEGVVCGFFDSSLQNYRFFPHLPPYSQLLTFCKN